MWLSHLIVASTGLLTSLESDVPQKAWHYFHSVPVCTTRAAAEHLATVRWHMSDKEEAAGMTTRYFARKEQDDECSVRYAARLRITYTFIEPTSYHAKSWIVFRVVSENGEQFFIEAGEFAR